MSTDLEEYDGESETDLEVEFAQAATPKVPPVEVYLRALKLYDGALLVKIRQTLGINEAPAGRASLASSISELLANPRSFASKTADLPRDCRVTAGVFALTERTTWSTHALAFTLGRRMDSFLGFRGFFAVVGPGAGSVVSACAALGSR